MRSLFILVALVVNLNALAQEKYLTKNGVVSFEASVPSFEEVKAVSRSTTAIINTENGMFAALVFVKSFEFKNALMEEHFNENYAESDKYPKAIFKGKIEGFSVDKLSDKPTIFKCNGTLSFHGKTKILKDTPLSFLVNKGVIKVLGNFKVQASDFNIKIPKILFNKVSETIGVSLNLALNKKK